MIDSGILEEVLDHIHNHFERDSQSFPVTDCAIENGSLPESVQIPSGAWYMIDGSWLNDGLHLHPATDLADEVFSGTITVMRIPRPLLRVVEDISAWQLANGAAADSPYQSESFGGYTYTKKSDSASQNGSGGLTGWRLAFRDRLSTWRKMA
jgi:hypothetical protein